MNETTDPADQLDASRCETLGEYAERQDQQDGDQIARQRQREFEIECSFCDRCDFQMCYHPDLGEPVREQCGTCIDYCFACCRCSP